MGITIEGMGGIRIAIEQLRCFVHQWLKHYRTAEFISRDKPRKSYGIILKISNVLGDPVGLLCKLFHCSCEDAKERTIILRPIYLLQNLDVQFLWDVDRNYDVREIDDNVLSREIFQI